MTLDEYKKLVSDNTYAIANEIKRRYTHLNVEVIKDTYYSNIKINDCNLYIDYPSLDFDNIYKDGCSSISITKEMSDFVDRPAVDNRMVRQKKMLRVKTLKSKVNYTGSILDVASFVDYLSKRSKLFKDLTLESRVKRLESLMM